MRPRRTLAVLLAAGVPVSCREPPAPARVSPPPAAAAAGARGVLEGRVVVEGAPPAVNRISLPAGVARACGDALEDGSLRVGAGGALRNAVVFLEAPAVPNAAPADAVLDQRRCAYQPRVLVARAGDRLVVVNSDALLHNVRAGEGARTWFNVAMPFEGLRSVKPLPERPATFTVGCDVHPWMRAWVKTFAHPWFARTAEDGSYRIEGIPPGSHRVRVWHERFPEQAGEVSVGDTRPTRRNWTWRMDL